MKYLILTILNINLAIAIQAQDKKFSIHFIALPPELSYYDNQFSSLQVADKKLYLMSESRLEDEREPKLYAIDIADIDHYLKDTTFVLPYKKIMIHGLDSLRNRMKKDEQEYEGLEAFVIDKQTIYFSVETNTPSSYCYLLKGKIDGENVYLSPTLTAIKKPRKPDGSSIYNAGFEAITLFKNRVHAFFEYNYFDEDYVYSYDTTLNSASKDSMLIDKLPFRITDITAIGNNHFTAINFFYKGEGGDTIYRVAPSDTLNNLLTKTQDNYHDYCRLIEINCSGNHFYWKPLWVFPKEYTGYNWEGIAVYNDGYFLINDKYTLTRPYASVLLYIK